MRTNLMMALAMGAALVSGAAQAQFQELENPGSVSAVQERKYRMNHELELGIGALPLDAFYKGLTVGLGYTYHFNDAFAWRVGRGTWSYNLDTGLREQLERDFNVLPTRFEEVEWMAGSDLIWSPLYGKAAWLNESVLHFAGAISLGGTVLALDNGGNTPTFRPALNVGLSARLYSSDWLSFNLSISDNIVVADRIFHVPTFGLSTSLNFGATE